MTQKTILIVEDTDMTRKLYRVWLRNQYNLLEAENGKTALAYIKEKSIDCILLDYQLPDTNGIELLKQCSLIQEKNIPVIIITAHGNEHVAAESLKLGAVDYFVKSDLTQESLIQAIFNVIEKAQIIQKTRTQYSKIRAGSLKFS